MNFFKKENKNKNFAIRAHFQLVSLHSRCDLSVFNKSDTNSPDSSIEIKSFADIVKIYQRLLGKLD